MTETSDPRLRQFQTWFKADREHSKKWRKDAEEDFAFLAGEQWSENEKRTLKDQLRPAITFNRTHPIINSISGMEIVNRQEVKYFPREQGDAKANELLTEGAKWFRDQADADDEDSDAFLDAAVCGMGWTETTLDMEEDDEGNPTMVAVNPLEMYWDKSARQKNVADAERIWRVRDIARGRAKEMFPDADDADLDAKWAAIDGDEATDETQEEANRYQDADDEGSERDEQTVTIVHLQYKSREPVYLVAAQQGGQTQEVSSADLKKLKERAAAVGMQLSVSKKTRTVIKNVFLGGKLLQQGAALCKSHFSFQCVTAYKEHKTGTFYGLMRLMKDPQRWANKWMSQALHILNSNAKGGLLVEEDAVDDMRKFEQDWARTDKVTKVNSGALIAGKIKEKQQTAMPAGFFQMMEFAIQSVRDVTGVSVELLGMREATQAASLEQQRKQAGMTIIAPLFDNLRRYRRDHGKLMLYIIQKYLADGRLVRIVGKEGAQYVPLALEADAKYDIIVDDQPNSPDQKMTIWQSLVQLMPMLPPEVQLALVDYAPLPTSVIEKIKEAAGKAMQNQQGQQPDPAMAKVQLDAKVAEGRVQIEAEKAKATTDNDWRKALLDAITKINVAQIGAQTDTDSAQFEAQLKALLGRQQMVNDHAIQDKDQQHAGEMQAMQQMHDRQMQASAPQPAA